MTEERFNPLAMESLAEAIVQKLMDTEPVPLDSLSKFAGAGIYAIYYVGAFPAYELVKDLNVGGQWRLPIYVGKAMPKGGRQGLDSDDGLPNTAVWSRLREHAKSIAAAENLDIRDFYARWLIVDEIWIALGESALIRDTRPVWNATVDGFGNHNPGSGRYSGLVPLWDTLHPGREWAKRLKPRPADSKETIARDAKQYLEERHR